LDHSGHYERIEDHDERNSGNAANHHAGPFQAVHDVRADGCDFSGLFGQIPVSHAVVTL
jgi:hypothetical protein